MQMTLTSRRATLEPTLAHRVDQIAERLQRLGTQAVEGIAIFDLVAGLPWVELRLSCRGGITLVATATADDHRTALDVADRKLRRQLHRSSTRVRATRHAVAT